MLGLEEQDMGWRPTKREVPGHWTAGPSRWEAAVVVAAAAVTPAVAEDTAVAAER